MTTWFLLAALAVPAWAQQHYSLEAGDGAKMELRVHKTGLYRGKVHVFVFPSFTGSLVYDAAKPEASQVRLAIPAGGIQLTDTWLSKDDFQEVQRYALEEMLDAKRYPEIRFESQEIVAIDAAHFKVAGTLTIRGLGKPSIVDVTLAPEAEGALRIEGSAVVKLTNYGLKPPKAALGLIGTKDEMDFTFALTARSDQRAPATETAPRAAGSEK